MVNASKGETAVVCFQANFNNVFLEETESEVEISIQVNLTLEVTDIETSKLTYSNNLCFIQYFYLIIHSSR